MIPGGKQFIKEPLQHGKDLQSKDISHRRTISSTMSCIDEILSRYFAVLPSIRITPYTFRESIEEDDSLRQEMDRIEGEMYRIKG